MGWNKGSLRTKVFYPMWLAPSISNSSLNVGWSYNCYNLFFLIWTILLSGHHMSAHVWNRALDPHPLPPTRHTPSSGSLRRCLCLGPGDTISCLVTGHCDHPAFKPAELSLPLSQRHLPVPLRRLSPDLCVPRCSSFKAWRKCSSLESSSQSLLLMLSFCFLYCSHHS